MTIIMIHTFRGLCAALLTLTLLTLSGCGGEPKPTSKDSTSSFGSSSALSSAESVVESMDSSTPASSSDLSSAAASVTASQKAETSSKKESSAPSSSSATATSSTAPKPTLPSSGFYFKGLWISCFEMPFSKKDTAATAKTKIDAMMKLAADQGYNAVFCHVRPFADAFYPSKYFPHSKYVSGTEGVDPGYDALQLMLNSARSHGLQFHAWINPYRVSSSTTDPTKLSAGNIAAQWLTDGSGRAVVSGKGIYLNPASFDAQQLVLNGIREIIETYDVDGIHFDDYFYPTTDPAFDSQAYSEYTATAGANPLSLDDWRRANVNTLVSSAHSICAAKNVTFGISPAADITKNYNQNYADVALWTEKAGYVDYIIPQIYFGYNHPTATAQYAYLLDLWSKLPRHEKLQLYIGLGAYRMNEPTVVDYAEWSGDASLLARQAMDAKTANTNGVVVFSYGATSSTNAHNQLQIKNLFDAIA